MGYRVNVHARAMRHGRVGNIALIMSKDPSRSLLHDMELNALHDALAQQNLSLMVVRLDDATLESESDLPRVLTEYALDGLLINYKKNVPPLLEQLIDRHHIPAVWIARKLKHDAVYYAYRNSVRYAVKKLITLGHQHIIMATSIPPEAEPDKHYSLHDQIDSYSKAMHANGFKPQVLDVHWQADQLDELVGMFKRSNRPTMVLTRQPQVFLPILTAAYHAKVKVPQELGMMLIGHHSNIGENALTHRLAYDYDKLADAAVALLVEKIKHPQIRLKYKAISLVWQSKLLNNPNTFLPPRRQGRHV